VDTSKIKYDEILRECTSADGQLELLAIRDGEDYIGGFVNDDSGWHIHGDMLVPEYGDSPRKALLAWVEAIIDDKEIIAISKMANGRLNIWHSSEPGEEKEYVEPGEKLVLRYWSGREYVTKSGSH
jgi:hypothetical protein